MIEPTDKEVIGSVRKNRFRAVRVSLGEWGGRPYVYLHTLQHLEGRPDSEAEERPGGFTLAPAVWRSLLPVIQQACELADKRLGERAQVMDASWPPRMDDRQGRKQRTRGGRGADE